MKFLQVWCSSPCFQLRGQETSTALCFSPPSPLAWRRWDVASRRFEDTVTWQKPFTFSVSISLRRAWRGTTSLRFTVLLDTSQRAWNFDVNCSALFYFVRHPKCPRFEHFRLTHGVFTNWLWQLKASHLLCTLSMIDVLQVGSLQGCANDGQPFPRLQLIGQREQTRLLHILLSICAHQNQQLRPLEPEGERREGENTGRKKQWEDLEARRTRWRQRDGDGWVGQERETVSRECDTLTWFHTRISLRRTSRHDMLCVCSTSSSWCEVDLPPSAWGRNEQHSWTYLVSHHPTLSPHWDTGESQSALQDNKKLYFHFSTKQNVQMNFEQTH